MKVNQFQILSQVGQGGYGQVGKKKHDFLITQKVFLARKKDTNELCALKKMNKSLLIKLNEV